MLQLLILLLTVLVTSGTECPTMCICKHFPREIVPKSYLYYTSVRCEGFNSNATLNNFTRILEVSRLDGTSFSELFQTLSESDLPELNNLVLTHSTVSNLSDLLYSVGRQLKFLKLSHNNLTEIPELGDDLSVISLDLSANEITSLPSSYHPIRTLETLNLSENSIKQIKPESFKNLEALKILDLSKNYLFLLDNQSLTPLVSLQYLNLSHNNLKSLNDKCFSSLLKLQQLDVSSNNLARVAPGSLQLPSLARLLLAGNTQLGDSSEVLVQIGQRVHTVDVSETGLKQVPPTLTHSIRILQLSRNFIQTVTCGELDAYPLLQFLDFTSNDLFSIEEDALGRLEALSVLYLPDNKLETIPKSFPEKLTVLHLQGNAIRKISKDDLYGLPNLEVLLLNDNKILIVEAGAFSDLNSLITLDLSRNPIKALPPGSLSGPSFLQFLRLSGIDTVSPAEDVSFPLSTTDHLVTLDLSGSSGLARQFLSDTAALAASRELQELDISGTDLELIRSDLLHFLSQLRVMHIKDNRLNCSNLLWLAVWMRRQDQPEYRSIKCASPQELWGTTLLDLQYAQAEEIVAIKQIINHESNGTINLETKNISAMWKSHSVSEANTSVNGIFFNKQIETNDVISASVMDNKTKNKVLKQTLEKKIKSDNKELVSSADVGPSSLIPVSNDRKYFVERTTVLSKDRHQETDSSINITENDRNSAEKRRLLGNNGPSGVLHQSKASHNQTPNERIFNDTSGLAESNKSEYRLPPPQFQQGDVNMTENMAEWNSSTVKTSMYRNNENPNRLLHPGMLILAVGVLGGAVTLATLAVRFNTRKRWTDRRESSEEIPVTSISSVTELW
ncbi:unnamed protein product [Ceutorhynchus assimilis]|uniref:Uncharacterized protein n=1 Tax=Ceutorhynchus assimilis TaxID=467358 RepID=A0A9N9MI34_9CUCU|nr:unnamed protein product [Ceutorhynchus assimilis]